MTIRTRNAPSPTGIPHIGNSRTALYDYLLAKKYHGQFILRIEDTDQKRLVKGALEKIYEIHEFLGLIPDEKYIQTKRLDLYQKYARELLTQGFAYEKEGAIRFKVNKEGYSTWKDLVQGKLSIPNQMVDDKVLLKSDGVPTYHLASVVDDHLMKITHVLRGVEYISSTPLHLQMYQAFGWEPPIFCHVSLLLGPDKSKLSKRHGAASVLEYRDNGYLPEAINNFLFYLGFSYHDNSELLTLEEMIKVFDETKLTKQNAIFDLAKLNYFNAAWIRRLSATDFISRLKPYLPEKWQNDSCLSEILPLVQARLTTLADAKNYLQFFFEEPKKVTDLNQESVQVARNVLESVAWNKEAIEKELVAVVEKNSFNKSDFFMNLRLAVCGQRITPPLTESMLILGKGKVIKRLQNALK